MALRQHRKTKRITGRVNGGDEDGEEAVKSPAVIIKNKFVIGNSYAQVLGDK